MRILFAPVSISLEPIRAGWARALGVLAQPAASGSKDRSKVFKKFAHYPVYLRTISLAASYRINCRINRFLQPLTPWIAHLA